MKKRILCVILSLVAVFRFMGFNATEAWFGSGENKSMILKSGDLDFTASGDLALSEDEKDLILPGAELDLKEAIVITNLSTIDTELRVRVECTYVDKDGVKSQPFPWIEFVNQEDTESKWYVDENDGCIYYCPNGANSTDRRIPATEGKPTETTTVAETTTEAETEATTDGGAVVDNEVTETTTRVYAKNEIPLAGTIIISGDVPIDLQGKEMTIKFILEAKQADFLTWEQFDNLGDESVSEVPSEATSEETSE
ncbi:MAG: hypothetical protein E7536_03595 [Ruminococcaceae bacterium]|nr:hypothetical protein [Oscillospiraceae bacterium]